MFLTNVLASGSSAAVFERRENNILRVCGRSLDTIDIVAQHKLSIFSDVVPGDERHFGTTIHRIAHQFHVSDDQLESFCHALIAGFFDHHTYPQSKSPSMASSLAPAMELISKITKTPNIIIKELSDSQKTYVLQAANMLENRAVYKTKGGKFGLAPNSTEPGDIAVALLGLGMAMILRGADDNTYKVVGESYCQGYMSCEGFLGQLPKTHRLVWVQSERAYGSWPVYYEVASGTLSVDDPRSGALPAGCSLKDHEEKHLYHLFVDEKSGDWGVEDPRLSPEVLSARGVDIQYFDLI